MSETNRPEHEYGVFPGVCREGCAACGMSDQGLQARLANGERGIPKIPDSPDTRHAQAQPHKCSGCNGRQEILNKHRNRWFPCHLCCNEAYQKAWTGFNSAARPAEQPGPLPMNDELIKHMVSRFLGWRLPENFNPDGGISFKTTFNEHTAYPMKREPTGTNLFDAMQAEGMIRYMLEGVAEQPPRESVDVFLQRIGKELASRTNLIDFSLGRLREIAEGELRANTRSIDSLDTDETRHQQQRDGEETDRPDTPMGREQQTVAGASQPSAPPPPDYSMLGEFFEIEQDTPLQTVDACLSYILIDAKQFHPETVRRQLKAVCKFIDVHHAAEPSAPPQPALTQSDDSLTSSAEPSVEAALVDEMVARHGYDPSFEPFPAWKVNRAIGRAVAETVERFSREQP